MLIRNNNLGDCSLPTVVGSKYGNLKEMKHI